MNKREFTAEDRHDQRLAMLNYFKEISSSQLSFLRRASVVHLVDGLSDVFDASISHILDKKLSDNLCRFIVDNKQNPSLHLFLVLSGVKLSSNYASLSEKDKETLQWSLCEVSGYYFKDQCKSRIAN